MTKIQKLLFEQQDKEYADFTRKLNPTIDPKSIIGVRIPKVRQIAKTVKKMPDECEKFLNTLPHKYFDENMLHSILLSTLTNYDDALARVDEFLPYVNN